MASWKRYFNAIPGRRSINRNNDQDSLVVPMNNFSSFLPEFYAGQPQRIERYGTYDLMDLDPVINSSLDIIAESCTIVDENVKNIFRLELNEEIDDTQNTILLEALKQWTSYNNLNDRIFKIFRNVLKYGDQFFIRDPSTYKWLWVDHAKVNSIIVNQAKGKKIEAYLISDLDLNLKSLVGTKPPPAYIQSIGISQTSPSPVNFKYPAGYTPAAKSIGSDVSYVSSDNIIHLSLSDGMDNNWPFGISILENIYKTYKQKELLEDAIIIYRIQRAPERRIFYIDVGNMPAHKARRFLERIKNEIHQRRIPNRTGGGSSIIDSSYNPLSILEDYFFAVTSDGRGSRVETLPGGEQLGQIDDLLYFDNKMKKGLRIPTSYLPGNIEENAVYSDGRVGTAYIQEFRFVQYCKRLQKMLIKIFDDEFKKYLHFKNIRIDPENFKIMFNEPQNFAKFRQIEVDTAQINVFQPLSDVPYLSKRFLMKRFLNLSDSEILENERLWMEENYDSIKEKFKNKFKNGKDIEDIEDMEDLNKEKIKNNLGSDEELEDLDKLKTDLDTEEKTEITPGEKGEEGEGETV